MDHAPPVPPKDTPRKAHCMAAINGTALPVNGSKRKREATGAVGNQYALDTNISDGGSVTAHIADDDQSECSLSHEVESEEQSDSAAVTAKGLRRTRKIGDFAHIDRTTRLSNKPSSSSILGRQSKFQEGSLTDKSSETPPTIFIERVDSGIYLQHEQLLSNYHLDQDSDSRENESADALDVTEETSHSGRTSSTATANTTKDQGSSFFRLSRNLAATLHPLNLWNKLWNESKEELAEENMDERVRKDILKMEAERRYTQMKLTGQFAPYGQASQAVSRVPGGENCLPRGDCHIDETNGGTLKPAKRLKTRANFKRPSLSNLYAAIKPNSAETMLPLPLVHDYGGQDSSLSLPSVKSNAEHSPLSRSPSKSDLRRHHKLSKKVSDLEAKLSQARRELDEALSDASPMPRFHSQFERFSSGSTLQRPKFVPGLLPSLPSERLLLVDNYAEADSRDEAISEPEGQETIKAVRNKQHPPRVSSLFYGRLPDSDAQLPPLPSEWTGHAALMKDTGTATSTAAGTMTLPAESSRRRKRRSGVGSGDAAPRETPSVEQSVEEDNDSSEPVRKKHKQKSPTMPVVPPETNQSDEEPMRMQETGTNGHEISATIQPSLLLSARSSIDSQAHSLEPVYEEDEDTAAIPHAVETPKPEMDQKAILNSLPESTKRKRKIIQDTPEELMITRAAAAAQQNRVGSSGIKRVRQGTFEWPDDVF